ncbi:hypothetical protein HDV00_003244 [Rhizophlyctis rosea]|nr:hypothetical protein HDV00_003244 [Rhizophlyctis rosea]
MEGPSTRSTPIDIRDGPNPYRSYPTYGRSIFSSSPAPSTASSSSSSSSSSSNYSSRSPFHNPSSSNYTTQIDLSESRQYINSLTATSGYVWNEEFLLPPGSGRRRMMMDAERRNGGIDNVYVDEILLE